MDALRLLVELGFLSLYWLGYLISAWFLAELFSGMFHWWEDRYGNPDWPVIGPVIITPNILHHKSPRAFARGSYIHRNWTTILPTVLLAGLCYFLGHSFFALAFLFASQSNEIHCWSHIRANSTVRKLQKLGVLQSPRMHAIHHQRPYDQNYCVMTDYLNPVLAKIYFWSSLEWVVSLFGVYPREERKIY